MDGCKDGSRAADPRSGTAQVLAPSPVSAESQWVGAVFIGSSVAPARVGVLEGDAVVFEISRSLRGKERVKKRKEKKKGLHSAAACKCPASLPSDRNVTYTLFVRCTHSGTYYAPPLKRCFMLTRPLNGVRDPFPLFPPPHTAISPYPRRAVLWWIFFAPLSRVTRCRLKSPCSSPGSIPLMTPVY